MAFGIDTRDWLIALVIALIDGGALGACLALHVLPPSGLWVDVPLITMAATFVVSLWLLHRHRSRHERFLSGRV